MSGSHWKKRDRQVVWEDLRPWTDRLWNRYGAQVSFNVVLTATEMHVHSAVVLEITMPVPKGRITVPNRLWGVINTRDGGGAEAVALQLLSRFYLDLEGETLMRQERAFPLPL